MKKALIIFSVIFVLAIIFFMTDKKQKRVCFKKNCFFVELAITDMEKANGLMFREKLDEGSGMLFVYDKEGVYGFWMKNTRIPLDIIWINSSNEVVFINKNTIPCYEKNCPLIKPEALSKYVLEINAGLSDKIGLKLGDKLLIYE